MNFISFNFLSIKAYKMKRQIVLDTETTGLDIKLGHKIIEIGCIELKERKFTGKYFHTYLNPQRDIDKESFNIHGITRDFLEKKPFFKDIAMSLLKFIKHSELIIHNAKFDIDFLEHEFKLINNPILLKNYCSIFDTLIFARKKYPGRRNTLNALCKRYKINISDRNFHGALLDAKILASLYLEMTSGQTSLFKKEKIKQNFSNYKNNDIDHVLLVSNSPIIYANSEELRRHNKFISFLKKDF
ncbi:DNA polymerase III subunit epsilon [Candidatus Legionella polyplacis]|uniref:DNA polymerase III subunit epsilon n=1 Tax=Candidatus Legionella polyplacis TaxID=2005262 RepID=UPI000C1F8763|nr:DNA polymerase III subunit epsilon [Candidatus Legionella polyplacis]ATW01694.1 DNA polymerase III subunit epsilon [Candidatus Legionella polyplacis]